MLNLTPQQLRQAASLKEQIAGLEHQLSKLLGGSAPAPAKAAVAKIKKGKGGMSAAAKAKLSQIAKARWAKIRAAGKKRL